MTQGYDADVIILSWDRVEDTIAAIDSALAQRGVSRRIKIVDQGSKPENIAAISAHVANKPDVELKLLGRNVGVPAGRNLASRMGSGRYIVALDSDAEFADADTLARAVRHLDEEPDLCAIGFRILNYFNGLDDETSWDYPEFYKSKPDAEFFASRFIGAGHGIRRSVFETVGGYDERLFFCGEELDLSYRMLNLGYRIRYQADVVVLHKVSPERRVGWGGTRYFYSVRNHLYTQYKYGRSLPRLGLSAAAFAVKGAYNGVLSQSLKAIAAAIPMCRALAREQNREHFRLRDEVERYIRECELKTERTMIQRLERLLTKLPGQTAH